MQLQLFAYACKITSDWHTTTMIDETRPSGLIVPSASVEPSIPEATSSVPYYMCYLTGQFCRELAMAASYQEPGYLVTDEQEQEADKLLQFRETVVYSCGRACLHGCRLPDIDAQLHSRLLFSLDVDPADIQVLTGIISYLDQCMDIELSEHDITFTREMISAYTKSLHESTISKGAKPFACPDFTDRYYGSFAKFSGPNFHVIKRVTHNLVMNSYEQQTGAKLDATGTRIELPDPLNISEQDLRSYLIKLNQQSSQLFNISSTERRDILMA